jgi:acyl carrier protein phosphodiesterase
MNYLAHIHLAHLTNTSMLGNFLGDFVKGSDLSHLSIEHQKGVRLHRQIDSYTDGHKEVKALKDIFPKSIRRMSGVVIDIYFDHLLCTHWNAFSNHHLCNLLERFYVEIEQHSKPIGGRFPQVRAGLIEYRWLSDYKELASCERALYQIEQRLRGRVLFAEDAMQFIFENKAEFNQRFLDFYPDLIKFTVDKVMHSVE